jgi:chemotaxis response regulator CheB
VGLGTSAALAAFIGARPSKTGLSFVVGEHLDRTHENLMPELLARSTTPEVHQALDRRGVRGSINHSFRSLTDEQHGAIGATTSLNRH